MTIEKGADWGEVVSRPTELHTAPSDAALVRLARANPATPLSVSGGDLHRTLGAPQHKGDLRLLPIDGLHVLADGRPFEAIAHVVARRGYLRGSIVGIFNVGQLGDWNVCPRAHPNDGRFDVIEVDPTMSVRERLQARRRLSLGNHVPHPLIGLRQAIEASWNFDTPSTLRIDGVDVGSVEHLVVTIEPDAFRLHV